MLIIEDAELNQRLFIYFWSLTVKNRFFFISLNLEYFDGLDIFCGLK